MNPYLDKKIDLEVKLAIEKKLRRNDTWFLIIMIRLIAALMWLPIEYVGEIETWVKIIVSGIALSAMISKVCGN